MRKYAYTFCTLILLNITSIATKAQSIPNGGFENWSTTGGKTSPDSGWVTTDGQGFNCTPLSSGKSTEKSSGSSSILTQTSNCTLTGLQEGWAMCTFPVNKRPDSLVFMYKSEHPNTNDSGYVIANFYKNTSGISKQIGSITYNIKGTQNTFKRVAVAIKYTTADIPDTAMLTLSSDWSSKPVIGNKIWFDDLKFSSKSTSNVETTATEEKQFIVYPQPANDKIFIKQQNGLNTDMSITILDISGRTMMKQNVTETSNSQAEIDITQLVSGIYFYTIETATPGKYVGKIEKL